MTSVADHHSVPAGPPVAASSISASRVAWLSHRGVGNRVDATTWTPLQQTDGPGALQLIDALGAAGIPALAAPVGADHDDTWQVYVDTDHHTDHGGVATHVAASLRMTATHDHRS